MRECKGHKKKSKKERNKRGKPVVCVIFNIKKSIKSFLFIFEKYFCVTVLRKAIFFCKLLLFKLVKIIIFIEFCFKKWYKNEIIMRKYVQDWR